MDSTAFIRDTSRDPDIRDRAVTDQIRNTNLFVTLAEEKIRVRIR